MKRLFDIIGSLVGLLLLTPFFLWIAWRIKSEDSGPAFYRGEHVGSSREALSHFQVPDKVVDAENVVGLLRWSIRVAHLEMLASSRTGHDHS